MTDPPSHLRSATSGDAQGCAFVHHTAWAETYSELLLPRYWEQDTLSRRANGWRRRLVGGTAVTVAEAGGQIIGFAMTTPAQLWVLEENPRARRFYERNGFIADGARCLQESLSLTEVRHVR